LKKKTEKRAEKQEIQINNERKINQYEYPSNLNHEINGLKPRLPALSEKTEGESKTKVLLDQIQKFNKEILKKADQTTKPKDLRDELLEQIKANQKFKNQKTNIETFSDTLSKSSSSTQTQNSQILSNKPFKSPFLNELSTKLQNPHLKPIPVKPELNEELSELKKKLDERRKYISKFHVIKTFFLFLKFLNLSKKKTVVIVIIVVDFRFVLDY
jgi:hypothetical protein